MESRLTPLWRVSCMAHAQTPGYLRRLREAAAVIRQIDPTVTYVGFSAGKDSAVIADLCHRIHPGIQVLMIDPGTPTHWTDADRDM